MHISRLWLTDFRNYKDVEISFAPDALTAVTGDNGEGKSNLLEAVGFAATRRSFRGATSETLVRQGAEKAIVRAEAFAGERELLVEMEIPTSGRVRMQVNRQNLTRTRDLEELFAVTVFTPDDLVLVKGGPAERRDFVDDLLRATSVKSAAKLADFADILKQRNALLRQTGGYLSGANASTLDVLDEQLAEAGAGVVLDRTELVTQLEPATAKYYDALSSSNANVGFAYQPSWEGDLVGALQASRDNDVRRGLSTVGPHRDEIAIAINELPVKTHASQGEQRSVVLALRLAGHGYVESIRKEGPILLLDDVFSELDPQRAEALVANLPVAQSILTSASGLPEGLHPERILRVANGEVVK